MRILVTGGAGFIGHHLVGSLVEAGYEVRVMDNLHRGSFERPKLIGAELVRADVRDPSECVRAVAGCDAVVHLAAQSNVVGSETSPQYTFETNVGGTWNIARACAESEVRTLVFASSREVYGDPATLPVREVASLSPKNLYGASKVAGEALLSGGSAGTTSVRVLRLANVIGPGDSGRVLPNWLAAARHDQPLTVFGGDQVLDFVPMEVVVRAIRKAIGLGEWDGPVNVGSGRGVRLLDLANSIVRLYPDSTGGIDRMPARPVEVTRFVADVGRMRERLGIEPPTDPLACLPGVTDEPW